MCITYQDVDRAILDSMQKLNYIRPSKIDSLEPPPEQIAESAEVIQKATHILAYRYNIKQTNQILTFDSVDSNYLMMRFSTVCR